MLVICSFKRQGPMEVLHKLGAQRPMEDAMTFLGPSASHFTPLSQHLALGSWHIARIVQSLSSLISSMFVIGTY